MHKAQSSSILTCAKWCDNWHISKGLDVKHHWFHHWSVWFHSGEKMWYSEALDKQQYWSNFGCQKIRNHLEMTEEWHSDCAGWTGLCLLPAKSSTTCVITVLTNDKIVNVSDEKFNASWVNSSPRRAAYMRQWSGSALFQIMAWCQIGAKPLSKSMLGFYQFDPKAQTSVNF